MRTIILKNKVHCWLVAHIPVFLGNKGVAAAAGLPRSIFQSLVDVDEGLDLDVAKVTSDGCLAAAESRALVAVFSSLVLA